MNNVTKRTAEEMVSNDGKMFLAGVNQCNSMNFIESLCIYNSKLSCYSFLSSRNIEDAIRSRDNV